MKIGLNFVDTVYRKELTPKNRIEMFQQPVYGCADFCRKAKAQRHEIIIYFDVVELKIHPSFVRKYLQVYRIPFSRIYQVTPCSRKQYLSFLDMVICPEKISCDGFSITFERKDIYRCATEIVGSSVGEWTNEQVDWFNTLFAEELRIAMDDTLH